MKTQNKVVFCCMVKKYHVSQWELKLNMKEHLFFFGIFIFGWTVSLIYKEQD